jgi:hypothetical protein
MDDEMKLLIVYSAYLAIPSREHFFVFIYIVMILSNIFKLFSLLFSSRLKSKAKFISFGKYIFCYIMSYFLIKDPNPFYYLLTFYLPFPNLFRGIFIVSFIDYYFNNKINNIIDEVENESLKKENKEEVKEEEKIKNLKACKVNKEKKIKKYFLSEYFDYFTNNPKKLIYLLLILIIISIIKYFYEIKYWIYITPKAISLPSDTKNNTKYYFCSILYNVEPIIIDWIAEMKKLINYLGKENVYVSILENGDSTDKTRIYLEDFQRYLEKEKVQNKIILYKITYKEQKERIVYLSELRDLSMNYLYEIENLDYDNTKIIFFNDIIYRFQDVVKLIGTNNGNYDSVCAMDFYEGFYDSWASQLVDGQYFRRYFPYMSDKLAQDAVINGEIIRTFSCWNGITVYKAKPFEDRILYFRHGFTIRQSECLLIHADMHYNGFQMTFANPNVKVAYNYDYYYKNHYLYPWTKNLITYFYYYFRYGILSKRNYKMINTKDRGVDLEPYFHYLSLKYFSK